MSTGGLSTTFYEGEASQLVLPLLVGVKGNIFINIDTKIFEREYVFNAIEHSFNFSNLKSNVSLIDHDRELTRVRVIQAVDRFIPYSYLISQISFTSGKSPASQSLTVPCYPPIKIRHLSASSATLKVVYSAYLAFLSKFPCHVLS